MAGWGRGGVARWLSESGRGGRWNWAARSKKEHDSSKVEVVASLDGTVVPGIIGSSMAQHPWGLGKSLHQAAHAAHAALAAQPKQEDARCGRSGVTLAWQSRAWHGSCLSRNSNAHPAPRKREALGVWQSGSLGVWESGSLGVWESGRFDGGWPTRPEQGKKDEREKRTRARSEARDHDQVTCIAIGGPGWRGDEEQRTGWRCGRGKSERMGLSVLGVQC